LSLKIENWKKAIEKGVELDNAVDIINKYVFQRERLYLEKGKLREKTGSCSIDKAVEKMLSYLDDFKDVFKHGEPEKKKDFIQMFVKNIVMHPDKRQARILLYKRPLSDIIVGHKTCEETEEVIFRG